MKALTLIAALLMGMGMQAQIDRSKQPLPGPAPTINLGTPQEFKAKNGTTVLVVRNTKLPRVSASLRIDNPPHKEGRIAGVSQLTSAMLGNGSTNMPKEEMNEEVDFLGARMNVSTGGFFVSGLSKYFDRLMELATDSAFNPNFTQEELDDERKKAIESLKNSYKDVGTTAANVRGALAYGKSHPYGEIVTEESLNAITLDDIKSYYATWFVPENAYLVVVGDVEGKEVERAVKKNFKQWKKAKAPSITIPTPKDVQYTQIAFVDMPNAVQSEVIAMNLIDSKMNDEDYHAKLVTNAILGGGFDSYLNQNLREDKGWTYGARTSMGSNQYSRTTFRTSAQVRNEVTDSTVVETLKEINRIRNEKVTMDKLAQVKAKYVGDFVLALERPQTIANYALNIYTNDLPKDFYQTYLSKINAVTIDDVNRIAQEYLKPNNLRIVVVGKGSEVLEGLENIDYNGKKIPVFYYDREGNKVARPAMASVDSNMSVQDVYKKYIDAVGGVDAVSKVNSVKYEGSASLQGQKLDMVMVKTSKGQFMQDIMMMGNSMSKQAFNGTSGYMVAQGQRKDFDETEIAKVKEEAVIFMELGSNAGKIAGADNVNGEDAVIVEMPSGKKVYYSQKTGLKLKESVTNEAGGQTVTVNTYFKDYKEVNGVMFPMTLSQDFGPMSLDFVMSKVLVNEGVTDADFN